MGRISILMFLSPHESDAVNNNDAGFRKLETYASRWAQSKASVLTLFCISHLADHEQDNKLVDFIWV